MHFLPVLGHSKAACWRASKRKTWLLSLAFLSSLSSPPFSILPPLSCPHFTLCFVPSPYTYLFFLSLLITFPTLSLFLSSFIRYLPPFHHCLFLLSLSNSIFLPLLTLSSCISVSLSVFSSFSPLSFSSTPNSSLSAWQPLQRQENTVVQGTGEVQF